MKQKTDDGCKDCVYHIEAEKCGLRACKGKTVVTPEGWLKKVSKLNVPCNACKSGSVNKMLGMECSKFGLVIESLTALDKAKELGCPSQAVKSDV